MEKPRFQFGLDELLVAMLASAVLSGYLVAAPGLLCGLATLAAIALLAWSATRLMIRLFDWLHRQPPDA